MCRCVCIWILCLAGLAKAELEQLLSDDWLGYFVGWEERTFRYGFGADGIGMLTAGKEKLSYPARGIVVRYFVQEQVKGKWVNREPKGGKKLGNNEIE